ncbi:vomeronasal type-1 receptor 4-like [Octodon degus]|uniref:Vomeronasal type-1 receptor n=1 Tax=Octodon degus TaxID=10160 RepID=A0A6P3FQG1_OCTDE|nr:vomeronasal type-1 receptor 4-like [Octodon degus]
MSFAQRNNCHFTFKEILEENKKIASRDLAIGIVFLLQTVVGIMGNFSLLYHYFFLKHTERKLRSIDLIMRHLFMANSLLILSKGPSQTMVAFGLKQLFSEFSCSLNLYVLRVGRAMSICTVCLLSVFQTITISPMNSCWKTFKIKAPKYIGFSVSLCWLLQMGINFIFPLHSLQVSGKSEIRNITKKRQLPFCTVVDFSTATVSVYIALVVSPEVCFIALTMWTSVYMIFALYRHKEHVKHIHSTNIPSRSPESKASKSIFLLVSTFVSFYIISSIFHIFAALSKNLSWWLVNISGLISVLFPTISPFLVMSQDSSLSMFWSAWIKNRKIPSSYKKYIVVHFDSIFLFCAPHLTPRGNTEV